MDLLLIDNSNIFIEVKNLVGPEGRFDYDRFDEKYINSRNQKKILVGSTPPKSDNFWSTMKHKGYDVYTYERKSQGEKAVDSKIIAKGVSFIVQQEKSATLNLLSGDFDMLPLIEEALDRGWNVNLWSWRDSLSKDYLEIEKIKIKYLDDVADELIYFNYEKDGYWDKEYFKERELRLAREHKEEEFLSTKQDAKNKILRLDYITNKDDYLNQIDKLLNFEDDSIINDIITNAQIENNKLKKETELKKAEKLRQQEEHVKEVKKQARKEFWKQNGGWLAGGAATLVGLIAYTVKRIKR